MVSGQQCPLSQNLYKLKKETKMKQQLTWLDNRAEMYVFLQDEMELFCDRETSQMLYKMTLEQLQALCQKYINKN